MHNHVRSKASSGESEYAADSTVSPSSMPFDQIKSINVQKVRNLAFQTGTFSQTLFRAEVEDFPVLSMNVIATKVTT